ncbi:hypothetical protein MHYP_G00225970 [Metynnis hypsauchen]
MAYVCLFYVAYSPIQCQELAVIAEQLQGVLSDAPDHTCGVQHQIKIPLGVVVQQQPSRATIEEEIHRILVTSITEPSDSLLSRPIIIMPKLDSLWRFCNNFQNLSEVPQFLFIPFSLSGQSQVFK